MKNRYVFRKAKQESDESFDQFHSRLLSLATGCNFPSVDAEVKSQIIAGCRSDALRKDAFAHTKWTLDKILETGRAQELITIQVQNMGRSNVSDGTTVNAIRPKRAKSKRNFG